MLKFMTVALVLTIGAANSVRAQEISETLAKPLRGVLESTLKPADLEFCVADAITMIGGAIPIPIRNGPSDVVMLGYGHTPKIVIKLNAVASGTRVEVYTKAGDVDGKLLRLLTDNCPSMTLKS